jgi:glucokinase
VVDTSKSALLADIGATSARFALLTGRQLSNPTTYAVADYASPIDAARAFIAGLPSDAKPHTALVAAAGPVVDGRVIMTNAAWTVDANQMRQEFGLQAVQVINDFEALGWSLPGFVLADLSVIGEVQPPSQGTMTVMGPGTGFGLSALASNGSTEVVLVTEAGHATLSSENRREDAIILALRERMPHVSVERVLSGPGLIQLYEAIAEVDRLVVPQRSSADIVAHALAGDCEVCRSALDAFCAFLGSAAGNAALTLGARGGVFIAGGIVPRFIDFLRQSAFRERFEAKGRMASYLAHIPTAVVVHPFPAFVGLTRLAYCRNAVRP